VTAFRWKSRNFLSCGAISHVEEPGLFACVTEQVGVCLLSYYRTAPEVPWIPGFFFWGLHWMCFRDNLACSQAPKPPETLTSPWLLLLSNTNSQTLRSTQTHVTICSNPRNHRGSAALPLLFPSSPAPTLTLAASYTGPLPPTPDATWHSLPSSLLVLQPVAVPASLLLAAAGGECPGETLPCPSPFSSARRRPSMARAPRWSELCQPLALQGSSSRSCGGRLEGCWQSGVWAALLELS